MKKSLIQAKEATESSCLPISFAPFHSTSVCSDKWKKKSDIDACCSGKPSKTYIKYITRQKRADTKRALKDLLFHSGSCRGIEDEFSKFDANVSDKRSRSRSSSHHSNKAQKKRSRRKHRRDDDYDDFDEHSERVFHTTYGNKSYSWTFYKQWYDTSSTGFEWRENSNWNKSRNQKWETASDIESDDESCVVGSSSDRTILGLPPRGHLKLEDVKNAFRMSALKWHPDKHQGPSQAMAEERFKLCVNAYKSLCDAIA